ncbi:UDP-N-acetylmuramate--L-alanine ligase [Candidatus Falkowbacteria bacterium]|nr:UDP-N-acetylmuramate--L-alanine ligase [Candidatus Falkowbacteria bacterium]
MIGVKGVGMAMLAEFLVSLKITVSGSDVAEDFMTALGLARAGVTVFNGFDATRVPSNVDLIIYSTAYNKNNPELAVALVGKVPIMSYAEALAKVFNYRHGIAVCGSHGKTTTTAWLGFVMDKLDFRPAVMVGARVPQFNGAGLPGASEYLVIEADEYQNKLQYLEPKSAILNNIDYDHPDFYPDLASYAKAFADFTRRLPSKGWLVANGDDAQVGEIVKNSPARLVSFGLTEGNEFRATELAVAAGQQYFRVWWKEQDLGMFTAHLIGKHNVYNALAVIAAAWQFEPDLTNLRSAVADFLGTTRRLEYRGEWHGSLIYDDYAHHPTEIKAVIAALKSMEPKRHLIAVFHPHTFTRTTVLFDDFASSFAEADEVIVLEIYASARETKSNLSSMELVQAIQKNYPDKPVRYATNLESAEADLRTNLKVGEVVLLLGAGDVFRVADRLLA